MGQWPVFLTAVDGRSDRDASVPRALSFFSVWCPLVGFLAPTIFIDEFHPCRLEHAADGLIIDPGELGLAGGEFGATNFQASAPPISTAYHSSERIDDRNALDLSAVAHVFGIQFLASERTGGGDDGGLPIR